mmetsp:Transcript_3629/g.9635  ORF Transcript_3629/g.9635 Transcript_3629/m.9635 type:complete len:96 (+) Transcript_3629:89-376(+)
MPLEGLFRHKLEGCDATLWRGATNASNVRVEWDKSSRHGELRCPSILTAKSTWHPIAIVQSPAYRTSSKRLQHSFAVFSSVLFFSAYLQRWIAQS